jgi:hypothetical protein
VSESPKIETNVMYYCAITPARNPSDSFAPNAAGGRFRRAIAAAS